MKSAKFLALIAVIIFLISCGKDDSKAKGRSVRISGTLGATYNTKGTKFYSAPSVDKVWVTPLYGGDPNKIAGENMSEHIQFLDLTDGGFSVDVDSAVSEDWLILLIDSTRALKIDQVIGYVTMGYGSDSMIKIPVGSAGTGNIDLGELNTDGSEDAVSGNTAETNESFFTLTPETLIAMAKTDDMLKAIKNIYVNYDSTTKEFYHVMPIFNFKSGTITDLAAGTATTPAAIVAAANRMYHFNIKTNDAPFTASDDTVDHFPPASITLKPASDVIIGGWDGLTTEIYGPTGVDGTAIPNTYGYVDRTAPNTPVNEFILGYYYFSGTVGTGYWELMKNDVTLCTFDVSQAFSVDGSDNPKIFVPVPTMTLDAGRNITKINITWYMYDSAGVNPYTAVTDMDCVESSTTGELYFQIFDQSNNENITLPVSQIEVNASSFSAAHNVDTMIASSNGTIVLNYGMNGVTFRFVWTK